MGWMMDSLPHWIREGIFFFFTAFRPGLGPHILLSYGWLGAVSLGGEVLN
jgi:hypothetical protein